MSAKHVRLSKQRLWHLIAAVSFLGVVVSLGHYDSTLDNVPTSNALTTSAAPTVTSTQVVTVTATVPVVSTRTVTRYVTRASRSSFRKPLSTNVHTAQTIAKELLTERGWSDQWTCLNSLVNRESGWNVRATNPKSGAYGIPQALPAGKMASAGADWRTNPRTQLVWMMGYLKDRYATPCGAWAHSQKTGWY